MQKFYVGIKGLIHDSDRGVLLMHKADGKHAFWELPGGRMDENESFEDTLTRELHEEIPNIGSVVVGEMLGAFKVNRDFPGQLGLVLIYFSVQAELPNQIDLSSEHDEYMFYEKDGDIPEPINPVVKNILENFYE